MEIDLANTTGDDAVDRCLNALVGIFENAFPDRVLGYFLKGSCADGTATPLSDIDADFYFKGAFRDAAERQRAYGLRDHCAALCPHELDLSIHAQSAELRWGMPDLKLASLHLYGEDFRPSIQTMPLERYARLLMYAPHRFLCRVRGAGDTLSYPLQYPNPKGEFLGYERHGSTKDLIHCVGKPALALVARTGRGYVKNKSDCIAQYRARIGDEWSDLVEGIYQICRERWQYDLPASDADKELLRSLCRRTLEFENHFLGVFRQFLLDELKQEDGNGLWMTTDEAVGFLALDATELEERIDSGELQKKTEAGEDLVYLAEAWRLAAVLHAGKVAYPEDAFRALLHGLSKNADPFLSQAAAQACQRLDSD